MAETVVVITTETAGATVTDVVIIRPDLAVIAHTETPVVITTEDLVAV